MYCLHKYSQELVAYNDDLLQVTSRRMVVIVNTLKLKEFIFQFNQWIIEMNVSN